MVSFLDIKTQGIESAEGLIKFLQECGASIAGIEFLGDDRGSVNNAEILEYQAEGITRKTGIVKRDVTPSESDTDKAAKIFLDKVSELADVVNVKTSDDAALKRAANAALSKGLKAGAEVMRKDMRDRVNKGVDNTGTALEQVTVKYGEQRMKKHGVPTTAVLKASGNLIANLSRASYKFTKNQ